MTGLRDALRAWLRDDATVRRTGRRVYWQRLPTDVAAQSETPADRPQAVVLREIGGADTEATAPIREVDVLCVCWGPSVVAAGELDAAVVARLERLQRVTVGTVTAVTVTAAGTGYQRAIVVFTGGGGNGAAATAAVAGGAVTAVTVTAGGAGYRDPPRVTVVGSGGRGAIATAHVEAQPSLLVHSVSAGGASYSADPDTGWDHVTRTYRVVHDWDTAA